MVYIPSSFTRTIVLMDTIINSKHDNQAILDAISLNQNWLRNDAKLQSKILSRLYLKPKKKKKKKKKKTYFRSAL
jgi:hypothetical protein